MLDLSTSAVARSYFYSNPKIMDYINNSLACVVQVTEARSCENSMYHNTKTRKNVFQLRDNPDPESPLINEHQIYPKLFAEGKLDLALKLLKETKEQWVYETQALLQKIDVPNYLLWFSSREHSYEANTENYNTYQESFLSSWMRE